MKHLIFMKIALYLGFQKIASLYEKGSFLFKMVEDMNKKKNIMH